MTTIHKLTLLDLVLGLRQSLLDARAQNNQDKLHSLASTFGRLVEEAYPSKDGAMIEILVALEDAARDSLMGVAWKSEIPTVAAIETAINRQ